MASIRKRGDRYNVQVRVNGKATSKTFMNKRDAETWAKQQELKIEQGGTITNTTLATVIDAFIAGRDMEVNKVNVLTWWKKELGSKRLSELGRVDVKDARKKLLKEKTKHGEPLKPATVNRRVAALSAVLTECLEDDLIDINPARIRILPEKNGRDRLLTDGERERILEVCAAHDQPALLPMVMVAMVSGARAGELIELRASDLDIERGTAILRQTKNGDTRPIPIRGNALDVLRNYLERHPVIGSGKVFRNVGGGVPFRYTTHWADAKREAGIDDLRFHDLRHDAASTLAKDGVSLGEIGALLGHRSAQMTKRYSHYLTEQVEGLGDRIAKRIDK